MVAKGKAKVVSAAAKGKGKKTKGKKTGEAMAKKEFYTLLLPASLSVREAGVTIADRSQGTYFAPDAVKGRTFEVNQGDLATGASSQGFRRFKFVVDGVRGKDAVSSFYGMELTSDKVKSIPRKRHTLITACHKVETADGYALRVFTIANTKRRQKTLKNNCYASRSQVAAIRKNIFTIIEEELQSCGIDEVMKKLMSESIGTRIEHEGNKIFPLQGCHVQKVKVLRRPKIDESQFDTRLKSRRVEVAREAAQEAE